MPLFRCEICKRVHDLKKPACPNCNLDPEKDPRDADHLTQLALIHFDPPGKYPGRGLNVAACNPKLRVGTGDHRFTGEKAAVTCFDCVETDVFQNDGTAPAIAKDLPKVGPLSDMPSV